MVIKSQSRSFIAFPQSHAKINQQLYCYYSYNSTKYQILKISSSSASGYLSSEDSIVLFSYFNPMEELKG